MLSPSVSITTPEGASLPAPSSRRRALSYLRTLSQTRSSAGSPTESSRTSPRNYFQRSTSYHEPRNSSTNSHTRRRSNSRPTEPTSPLADDSQVSRVLSADNAATRPRPQSPSPQPRSSRSVHREGEGTTSEATEDNASDVMARHRLSSSRRNEGSTEQSESPLANGAANGTANGNATEPGSRPQAVRATSSRVVSGENQDGETTKQQMPTIRFFPHQEVRNGRQSLNFPTISRTLPSEHSIIRVGRYSEREGIQHANPSGPSDAPVGFKSKVVSRKHCEFSFVDGQWQIKDVASSSGTFLNHIRLSQPNTESRLFPIKDGDIVQLGIDFRGGEEMIFRCVKIRIECNRSWQKKPNNFNKSRHAQLQSLAKDQPTAGTNNGECSICLGGILPCQSLFVAPCAHVWHYKCIRPLLEGKNSTYPQFQCPNCRAYTDLTADVDVAESDLDDWAEAPANNTNQEQSTSTETGAAAAAPAINDPVPALNEPVQPPVPARSPGPSTYSAVTSTPPPNTDSIRQEFPAAPTLSPTGSLLARRQAANPASSEMQSMNSIDMPARADENEMNGILEEQRTRTETPDPDSIISGEGPLTPRNNAGPFVFDGSAGRGPTGRRLVVAAIPEVTEGSNN